MRVAMTSIVLASFLLLSSAGGGEEGACNLKTVEKVFYCEDHDILLPAQLVSSVTYYACEECEEIFTDAGRCETCDEPLKKMVSGKDVCPHCYAKPEPAEACVKSAFECPDCEETSPLPGMCEDCETARVKKTFRALVEYICPECGDYSLRPGKCGESDCEHKGKPLVRTCSGSGTFPHTTPPAKGD